MAQGSNRTVRGRAAMELKLTILTALNKLADRDTQQMAVEDLQKIAETLPPEGISVFLNCLYELASDQKSAVRRECVRLFSALAMVHGELINPHLPKIIATVMRRIKDPDSHISHIRDACIDTMGILAAGVASSGSSSEGITTEPSNLNGPFSVFTKPLLDAMNEQSKSVQCGAAMCLARVVESARDSSPGCFQRLSPRIIKLLSHPSFMAKAALLSVVGALARVAGPTTNQYLVLLVPCVQESLQSTDWATRKAAADTLSLLGLVLGHSLSKFKASTLALLEIYRFDKVKPVRDSIADTMQVWNNIPDSEKDKFSADGASKGISVDDAPGASASLRQLDLASPKTGHVTSETGNTSEKGPPSECGLQNSQDKAGPNISRKKTPSLTDRKLNPEFFLKMESRNQDDWQIEVAVPRHSPSLNPETSPSNSSGEESTINATSSSQHLTYKKEPVEGKESPEKSRGHEDLVDDSYEEAGLKKPNGVLGENAAFNFRRSATERVQSNAWLHTDTQQQHDLSLDSSVPSKIPVVIAQSAEHLAANSCEYVVIQRQLSQVEREQCNLFEMVQGFMHNCQEGMLGLESRVQRLERAVEDMARNLATSQFSLINKGSFASLEAVANGGLSGSTISDPLSSRIQNTSEFCSGFPQRLLAYRGMTSLGRGGRDFSRAMEVGSDMWNDPTGRVLQTSLTGQQHSTNLQRNALVSFHDPFTDSREVHEEGEPTLCRRAWDRGSASVRSGEGPSARSVWRASKDEATLAAIRVAGGDPRATMENDKKPASAVILNASERASEASQCQAAEQGNSSSWVLWTQVMEDLHSGDFDAAYEEVLSCGDELLLVRLMNKTGPVLDQLSNSTVLELMHTITLLVQQENFLDCILPWGEQVLDLIQINGPDYLNMASEMKKDLVLALHGAQLALDHSESVLAIKILKLARKLAISWSIDLDKNVVT